MSSSAAPASKARLSPTTQIMLGLVLGLLVGYVISITDPSWANIIRPFSQIFIRMIRMIIAPLLFG
ncbi:MAG: cation:dicarboxylase symporter family transporter, partial [Acidobacteria bacterium]|nr:cation:dicarboxylase symporter family transporter [Acidobacteriota bacterium]